MFGRKEKNMIVFKAKNGLSVGKAVELMALLEKTAATFPNVTVCFELEGDFIHSAEESDDRDDDASGHIFDKL